MTERHRVCSECGAPMRDNGIQPDGSRKLVCTGNSGHILFVNP
jgi:hypothetical protein